MKMVMRWALLAVVVQLAACQPAQINRFDPLSDVPSNPVILVMPLDVELSLLTSAGILEPNAQWTEAAKSHITSGLSEFFGRREISYHTYQTPENLQADDTVLQLQKLHEAVAVTSLNHYLGGVALPHKVGAPFDLTLGDEVKILKESTGADYALFILVRDSYSSAGRVAMQVAFMLLTGAVAGGGHQVGFVSLVDLNTGDLVWINFLSRGGGDLRELEPAQETINQLLYRFPW